MSNDPLALSESLTELPQEADYASLYAVLTATERGRWFLTEYARRNRHADTDMLVGAIARVEAAIRGEPAPQAATGLSRDLIDIASVLEHIAANISAGAAPPPGVSAAVERIQDIAFVLHERSVEATLCDTLDAAVREISDHCAGSDSAAERSRHAVELLRALRGRVGDMIASTAAVRRAEPSAAEDAVARPPEADPGAKNDVAITLEGIVDFAGSPRVSLFDMDSEQAENLAGAVAALVASLPALAEPPQPAFDPLREPAKPPQSDERAASETFSSEGISRGELAKADSPSHETAGGREAIDGLPDAEPSSAERLPSLDLGTTTPAPRADDRLQFETGDKRSDAGAPLQSDSSRLLLPGLEPLTGPEEDPADLFEDEVQDGQSASEDLGMDQTSPIETAVPPNTIPTASDSLAAVRALSDEELIALFS